MMTPVWLKDAAALPVAFAQVREDPLIDESLAALAGPDASICMIASGGCTAATLAAHPGVALIHCVDPNPAQLALAQVKLALLRNASRSERLVALGHATCTDEERVDAIERALIQAGQSAQVFGPRELLDTLGFDHIGRYERLFAALRIKLASVAAQIHALLQSTNVTEQRAHLGEQGPLWPTIESAFLDTFALPHLVALFGEGATRNPRQDFSRHFLRRLRWALEHLPARTNSFLAQLLTGRFMNNEVYRWIDLTCPAQLAEVTWEQAFMVPALRRLPQRFDIVHLSNILDWLSPDETRDTLEAAQAALRPGGHVIVRQLNSSLDIAALGNGFTWNYALGAQFLAQDRSFFYRDILVGQKR